MVEHDSRRPERALTGSRCELLTEAGMLVWRLYCSLLCPVLDKEALQAAFDPWVKSWTLLSLTHCPYCTPRHFSCKIQGILAAANTGDSSSTGEHIRECEPQVPRGGWRTVCERDTCRACFSVTYREWQDSSSHTKGLMAFVAAAWPTLNRWLQQGEKQRQGLGAPPSEAPPRFYRYMFSFAACYFCFSSFPQVILLHGAQG